MGPEEEYVTADAVRVQCFEELRAMLRDGSDFRSGATFATWAMRHAVAADAQVRAALAMRADRANVEG